MFAGRSDAADDGRAHPRKNVPQPLVNAPPDVLDLVVEKGILPRLVDMERDLRTPLRLEVRQGADPGRIVRQIVTPKAPPGESVTGAAQVSFRMNYGGDRFLFRAEVIFPRSLSPGTGFSGFSVEGAVTASAKGYHLHAPHWTVQYNVWEAKGFQ